MQIEIIVSTTSPAWRTDLPEVELLVERAARAALDHAAADGSRSAELSLCLSDDAEVQALNRQFRGHDRPTNVLSFPGDSDLSDPDAPPALLGDVVLAHGVVFKEAREQGKSTADHVCHLTVHGVLHILGYDHESDDEAEVMEAAEIEILSGMGIADPYAVPETAVSAEAEPGNQHRNRIDRDHQIR